MEEDTENNMRKDISSNESKMKENGQELAEFEEQSQTSNKLNIIMTIIYYLQEQIHSNDNDNNNAA